MNAPASPTLPPFPTRFPTRPPLALTRRGRALGTEWPEGSAGNPPANSDTEQALRQWELSLAERERAVTETESRQAERSRDLDEWEALIRAREALVASARQKDTGSRGVVTLREAEALNRLKEELDRQEATLRESRQAVRDREKFLEESETRLFEKVQQQQEKESELEQREENVIAREARAESAGGPAQRPYDEFRE